MAGMASWGGSAERPALFFSGPDDFRDWLVANHQTQSELWMGLYKKHVPERGLTWAQAVPEALCFGWIDSVAQRIDADATRQRWTPRRPSSTWSLVNIAFVDELTKQGRMHPAGLAAFERRSETRTGTYSHEQGAQPALTPAEEARVRADPAAAHFFFERATATYRRTCAHWIHSAKTEATREKRLAELIADSAAGLMVKNQRYGEVPRWARPVE